MEKVFEKFNTRNTLLVISSYPPKGGEAAKQNAVACYTQNLLRAHKDQKIVVFSEIADTKGEYYLDGNILVVPTWRYQSPKLYLDLFRMLLAFDRPKQVLVQFEFNILGSFVHTAFLPFMLLVTKMMGKSVTVMMHQVVDDLASLWGHLNIKRGMKKRVVFNLGLHVFYYLMGKFSDAIIVHEEWLKDTLSKWVEGSKIHVVSHGLYLERQARGRSKIRSKLGFSKNDLVLLMFGYITWYKGTDWIIKKVNEIDKKRPDLNLKLIVAGGNSATLKNKPHYKAFVKKVNKLVGKRNKKVLMTDFVPDEDVAKYFTACDVVVLPYRFMMSASGPLSFALRFNKPFMVSEILSNAFKNSDIKFALSRLNIDKNNFIFGLRGDEFNEKIERMAADKDILGGFKKVTSDLRILRQWGNIVYEYDSVMAKAWARSFAVKKRGVVISTLFKPWRFLLQ